MLLNDLTERCASTSRRQVSQPAILLTGVSGYVGRLIASELIQWSDCALVLPVRPKHTAENILRLLGREMTLNGWTVPRGWEQRVSVVPLSDLENLVEIDEVVRAAGVAEVIHCAACIDYFAPIQLQRVNVDGTRHLLSKCKEWKVRRFIYISTSFSAGYQGEVIGEMLHGAEPESDPTDYTRSKRAAERLVVESGLPFLCLRPPIIIGDSRDGHYTGKQYGLYQLYAGIERLLCSTWEPEFHVIGTDEPVHLLHQDAFQMAFFHAWRGAPDNAFVNMISDPALAPSGRDLWRLWFRDVFGPDRVYYYGSIDDMPLGAIPRRQRAFVALASVNMEIAAHPWRFERPLFTSLIERAWIPATTSESVALCQGAFVRQSDRIKAFLSELRPRSGLPDEFVRGKATTSARSQEVLRAMSK